MRVNEKQFRCDECDLIFDYDDDWSEEEANAEAERLYGVKGASNSTAMIEVCDDCYKTLRARWEN